MSSQNKHRAVMARSKRNHKKVFLLVLGILLLLAFLLFMLEKIGVTNFYSKSPTNDGNNAKTTSKQPTAQSNYKGGDRREVTTSTKQEGTVTDNEGTVANTPPESQWTTSKSGKITVYSPAADEVLKSGDTLSGTSTEPKVSYRLIDNVSGQISQGALDVVDGKFSGTFNFTTKGTQGQVDVFTQAYDGTESNNVALPVRF